MDRGVIATATELFEARHFPGVIALISDALDEEPEHVPLLVLRARASIALRRDLDAQADLRDIIRLDPQCSTAYRLLGQLAARRDENESAAIFFREALRLDPADHEASEWLQIVGSSSRPAAAAQKLPAPAAAAGRFPRAESHARFAKGTRSPDEEAPTERDTRPRTGGESTTHRLGSNSGEGTTQRLGSNDGLRPKRAESVPSIPVPGGPAHYAPVKFDSRARELPLPPHAAETPVPALARGSEPAPAKEPIRTLTGRPPSRAMTRSSVPELPGFGDYLVENGILTRERLRAAQAYQRSMKVQLSTAIVTLGLATPQRIEWAAVAHQSQLGSQR